MSKEKCKCYCHDRLIDIKHAVELQALDPALWSVPIKGQQPIVEAMLQRALRLLHYVVEGGYDGAAALEEIERASN